MRFALNTIINLIIIFTVFFMQPEYSQCLRAEMGYFVEEKRDPRARKVEEEVGTINLLNNLDLSKDQMGFIIAKAKELERISKDLYKDYRKYCNKMFQCEKMIKRQVESGRTALEFYAEEGCLKTKEYCSLFYAEREYLKNKKQCNVLYYELNDIIKEFVKTVEDRLKDFQLVALDKYFPCIVPYASDYFIGGANKSMNIGLIVMGARSWPAERYASEKETFVAKNIAALKTMFCPCQRLREDSIVREEMLKTMEQIRKLDDADFWLNMGKIGLELEEKISLKDPELSRQEKIYKFLLSKQSIPILEKRSRQKK